MPRNRNLIDLRNIGKKIAGRLNEVGIFSEGDLRQVGAVGAHTMIRDKHCNDISEQRKQQLRAQVG